MLDTNIVFPHPVESVIIKTEIVVMDKWSSQHIILGSLYLNIHGIDINNHKGRIWQELIHELYTYNNAFASANEPSGAIKGHAIDITLNIDRPYPPVLGRPDYPASPRAREALEKHIQELIQLGVLRKVGHNAEVEVTTPVITPWHNDKSTIVGDFRELNTYTVAARYPIPRIQETLTQLSKANYITSMDALKDFNQNVLTSKVRNYLELSLTVVFISILGCHLVLKIHHLIIKE
ncbi:hypothetical protein O181_036033 [Austropuccinia psidii MF-1]|uniref:Reverse transcriptase domain-containing protein n=1 Tax=Austropuccinia psidii MF-1 TaxID=1389203 RepID=A0A9Q3D8P2_9BASI|nr:hypothetical protein [Austropuccinia psidii MF-1]